MPMCTSHKVWMLEIKISLWYRTGSLNGSLAERWVPGKSMARERGHVHGISPPLHLLLLFVLLSGNHWPHLSASTPFMSSSSSSISTLKQNKTARSANSSMWPETQAGVWEGTREAESFFSSVQVCYSGFRFFYFCPSKWVVFFFNEIHTQDVDISCFCGSSRMRKPFFLTNLQTFLPRQSLSSAQEKSVPLIMSLTINLLKWVRLTLSRCNIETFKVHSPHPRESVSQSDSQSDSQSVRRTDLAFMVGHLSVRPKWEKLKDECKWLLNIRARFSLIAFYLA